MHTTTRNVKTFLYTSIFLLLHFFASSQTDTLFWFVAPEVTSGHGDEPIFIRISSQNQAGDIVISQPANPNFPVQNLNIAANQTITVDLTPWKNIVENKPANQILNYGLKVESTVEIDVYYEVNVTNNPDIFTLKGRNALGTEFFVAGQTFWDSGDYNPVATSTFDIIAIEDNTVITITPSNAIVGGAAGTPFTIVLNEGQTYSGVAISPSGPLNVTGTKISSDKPIAVTYSDDSNRSDSYGGCRDLQGDQLVPIPLLGTEYIVIRGFLGGPDRAFVTAVENGTQIFINGDAAPVATINEGQTHMVVINDPSTFVETSVPAYVYHTTGFGCEVGGAILPPIECTGSNQVSFTRATTENFGLLLITQDGFQDDFLMNGNAGIINGGDFNAVPGTDGEWVYARIQYGTNVVPANQPTLVNNTEGLFHLAIINGGESSGCRYGFFSDFASISLEAVSSGGDVCFGETIELFSDTIPGATYTWSGPDGFTSEEQNPTVPNASFENAGVYTVLVEVDNCASIPTETGEIQVFELPVVEGISADELCLNEEIDDLSYFTPIGGTYTGDGVSGNSFVASNAGEGDHLLDYMYIDENGCKDSSEVTLTVHPTFFETVNEEHCAEFTWDVNGETYTSTGSYSFLGETINGCDSTIVLELVINPLPNVNAGPDIVICEGEEVLLNASGAVNYEWSNGVENGTSFTPDVGTFEITVVGTDGNDCDNEDSFNLEVLPNPVVSFTSNPNSGSVPLTVEFTNNSTPGGNYTWDFGNGEFSNENGDETMVYIEPGVYIVVLTGELDQCPGLAIDSIIVTLEPPSVEAPNVFTPNNDGTNDVFKLINMVNPELIDSFDCLIVNRWGNEIIKFNDYDFEWDGRDASGNQVIEGVYFYYINYNAIGDSETKTIHGFVHLVRQ